MSWFLFTYNDAVRQQLRVSPVQTYTASDPWVPSQRPNEGSPFPRTGTKLHILYVVLESGLTRHSNGPTKPAGSISSISSLSTSRRKEKDKTTGNYSASEMNNKSKTFLKKINQLNIYRRITSSVQSRPLTLAELLTYVLYISKKTDFGPYLIHNSNMQGAHFVDTFAIKH